LKTYKVFKAKECVNLLGFARISKFRKKVKLSKSLQSASTITFSRKKCESKHLDILLITLATNADGGERVFMHGN